MINLKRPFVGGVRALKGVSANPAAGSYPFLKTHWKDLVRCYQAFRSAGGNPWRIVRPTLPTQLENALRRHYESAPKSIDYLPWIRDQICPDVCPMCGSLATTSIDHFLPKAIFPEYSIYALNLVPACPCNFDKGNIFQGANQSEWFLHPYFDRCFSQRLLVATFSGSFATPQIRLVASSGLSPQMKLRVNFQLREIIEKNNVYNWLDSRWAKLVRATTDVLDIPTMPASPTDVRIAVAKKLKGSDAEAGTVNNWTSFLYAGVRQSRKAVNRLTLHVNGANPPKF